MSKLKKLILSLSIVVTLAIAFVIGVVFLVPLSAMGFFVLIKSRYNVTLLLACFYLS